MATAARFDLRSSPLNALENQLHEWRHSNVTAAQAKANARTHCVLGDDASSMSSTSWSS